LTLIPYKRPGCFKQGLGRVLLAPFPEPNVDSSEIDPELIVLVHYPPVGRCRKSGYPIQGERNGQYRHGERTKGAIAERQKFCALLKLLRAGLT
jgi:hypothetical protein